MKTNICILIMAVLAALAIATPPTTQAQTPEGKSALSPGPIKDKTVYLSNARGYAFAEFEVIMGRPPNLVVQVYNTSGATDFTDSVSAKFNAMDPKALAKQIGADVVVMNPRRWWLMDRCWVYDTGETHDFDGINATWMAKIALGSGGLGEKGKAFSPYKESAPTRASKYEWSKGSEVYLLRSADGHTWIMQAYTDVADKTLTLAELPKLGSKLHLPPGWKYEVKTLEKDLTLTPPAPDHIAHAVSDEFMNIYAGCDFGTTCNYIP